MVRLLFLIASIFLMLSCGTRPSASTDHYSAQGDSPFWRATMDPDRGITFEVLGEQRITYPYKAPAEGSSRLVWVVKKVEADGMEHRLRISLQKQRCRTSTAGQPYPYRADAEQDGVEYIGCGSGGGD